MVSPATQRRIRHNYGHHHKGNLVAIFIASK